MTRREIIKLLEAMRAAYPNAKITDPEGTVNAWEMAFGEQAAETIYKAARWHMNTNKFFPTVADIRAGIKRGEMLYSSDAPVRNIGDYAPNLPERTHKIISPETSFCDSCGLCDRKQQELCEF